MILFKPEHVGPILSGEKTQTRRLGKKRWNVGAVHQCNTKMFGEPFSRVHILDVYQEKLGHISPDSIAKEGYGGEDYKAAWDRINPKTPWDDELIVWVVTFERVICDFCKDEGRVFDHASGWYPCAHCPKGAWQAKHWKPE